VLNRKDSASVTEEVYVSRKFAAKPSYTTGVNTKYRWWIKNETLFAFGILLIELSFGQRLHVFKTAEDVDSQGNDTVFTEYLIATRLVRELANREPLKYAEAVDRCIFLGTTHVQLGATNADIENSNIQEQFYKDVIIPLQELCDRLCLP
jgi:hypothetical protein